MFDDDGNALPVIKVFDGVATADCAGGKPMTASGVRIRPTRAAAMLEDGENRAAAPRNSVSSPIRCYIPVTLANIVMRLEWHPSGRQATRPV